MLANTKSSLFLNLLYKSVKMDPNALRAAAFLKRISMSALITAPQVTAGLLFIISEVLQARPELKPMIDEKSMSKEANLVVSKKGKKGKYDNEEEEEDDDDEDDHDGNESVRTANTTNDPDYYLFGNYDANKRNPSYACMSEHIPYLHESHLLMHHFHPSVSAFATSLFTDEGGHRVQYKGDPLEEFTIMSFLNRFAYKNPKQQVIDELKQSQQKIEETEPINKQFESLLKRQQENSRAAAAGAETIAPDKRFFYKFFADRETLRALGKKKEDPRRRKGDDDEDDEEGSAEGSDLEKEIDDFADQLAADMMKHDALTRGEELGDDFDGDDFPDDDDFDEEEDDEDEEEEEKQSKNQKNNKKRKMEEMESEALDFESFRKEQEKQKNKKKTKKNSRADEDDDDIQEPEAYTDEFDQMPPADMEELDDDLMMIDDDDEDFDDFASKKVKKDKKGKSKGKKGRRDDDDDEDDDGDMDVDMDNAFADADLYEDQMEDNVQQFQFKAPAKPKFAVASDLMNDEDEGNANEKKGKGKGKQNKKGQKNNKNKNESKSNKKARKN
jgi:ribosome biogenesis protein MAK21